MLDNQEELTDKKMLNMHKKYVSIREFGDDTDEFRKSKRIMVNYGDTNTYSKSPEEVCIEDYRIKLIRAFLKRVLKSITKLQRKYLFAYIRNDYNALQTAEEIGCYENNIRYHLQKIREKAFTILDEMDLEYSDFKELIMPEICKYSYKHSSSYGYPFEKFMKVSSDNETWKGTYGDINWDNRKSCLIPEYLAETCKGQKIACPFCNNGYNCTRTDVYPENKYNNDAVLARLDKLEIMADMIADNYTEEECKEFGITKTQVLI